MAIFPLHLLYSLQSCSAACFWWCTCMSSPWFLFIKYGPNIRKICHESLGDVTSYQMEQGLYYWKFINQFSFMALIYFLFLLIDKCNITIINNICLIFRNYAINRLLLHCDNVLIKITQICGKYIALPLKLIFQTTLTKIQIPGK